MLANQIEDGLPSEESALLAHSAVNCQAQAAQRRAREQTSSPCALRGKTPEAEASGCRCLPVVESITSREHNNV